MSRCRVVLLCLAVAAACSTETAETNSQVYNPLPAPIYSKGIVDSREPIQNIPLGSLLFYCDLTGYEYFGEFDEDGNLVEWYYRDNPGITCYDVDIIRIALKFSNGILTRKTMALKEDIADKLVDEFKITPNPFNSSNRVRLRLRSKELEYQRGINYVLVEFLRQG